MRDRVRVRVQSKEQRDRKVRSESIHFRWHESACSVQKGVKSKGGKRARQHNEVRRVLTDEVAVTKVQIKIHNMVTKIKMTCYSFRHDDQPADADAP